MKGKMVMRKKSSRIVMLCIVMFSFVLLASCSLLKNDELDEKAKSIINAFVSQNKEELIALTHPEYVDTINNFDKLYEAMVADGIILDGSLGELKPTSRSYSAYDSKFGGKTTFSIYNAGIGDTVYIIKVRTLENKKGYGMINFDIGLKDK